ncbi:MAG: Uma2 family endonuclease [Myxococcales bacterium]|nr:Uma2 family endonuclease [Myxococcales bacterium]
MTAVRRTRLTADEFFAWAAEQPPSQRFELVSGEVVAMSPERAGHALVKHAIARGLEGAVERAGLRCEVYPDGMSVRIGDATVYEPDALLRCGEPLPRDAVEVPDPVVVVEVLSPSSRARDSGAKLEDYFRLSSVQHYLIAKTDSRAIIHHARTSGEALTTTIRTTGVLHLDPPGIELDVEEVFARL